MINDGRLTYFFFFILSFEKVKVIIYISYSFIFYAKIRHPAVEHENADLGKERNHCFQSLKTLINFVPLALIHVRIIC